MFSAQIENELLWCKYDYDLNEATNKLDVEL